MGRAALSKVQGEVDEGGHCHATHGSEHRKRRLARSAQLAHGHLIFEFDAHEKEEDRHQEVVHELLEREARAHATKRHADRRLEEVVDELIGRRVRDDDGEDGGEDHHGGGDGAVRRELLTRIPTLEAANLHLLGNDLFVDDGLRALGHIFYSAAARIGAATCFLRESTPGIQTPSCSSAMPRPF